tara:strand:- start:1317 stop:2180 length:864 start_codon:yes stop_codon:yes gene_type:complete
MKRSTHSKIKNTIILFELLTRQIASDTIQGKDNSPAIKIIKEYFNGSTYLAKELALYQSLIKENYKTNEKANYLISAVTKARKELNLEKLRLEKYNLIKEIKSNYDLESFFKTSLNDYKLYASIYRIFEGSISVNPKELVDSRFTIVEHIVHKRKPKLQEDSTQKLINEYTKQDEDVRLLAYRLLVDKFNDKYKGLSEKQKGLLKEYINNISNTTTLKTFVITEAASLKKDLSKITTKTKDPVIKIKLKEVVSMLSKYGNLKTINENNILSLLLYYELLKELKHANK